MQAVWCKWGGIDVILETNDLKVSPDRNVARNRMGTRVGIIAECEKGYLKGGRGGMVAVEPDGPSIQVKPASGEVTTPNVPAELIGPHYRKGYEVPKLA